MNGGYQTDQAISCSNAGHIGGAATLYNVNNTGLIDGGTLHGDTENHGHVAGGVFDNLRLYSGSTIDAGTFVGSVTVMGEMVLTFSSGTMANAVTVNDGGEIAGGTYSGTVALHGTISGGTFNGAVTANSVTGNIAGGTFANLVLANGPTLGIMAARPSYVCTLNQVTFTPAPPAADYPAEADVRSGVQFDSEAKTGTCKVPAAADVRKDTPVDATVGTLVATGGEAGINGSQILGMI
ncbi:MAG: hypothetical protein NTY53_05045 [Kiritimatiellaeota bacterium]|nr:hypothetical protein [Kiritimatiellota bacterium]